MEPFALRIHPANPFRASRRPESRNPAGDLWSIGDSCASGLRSLCARSKNGCCEECTPTNVRRAAQTIAEFTREAITPRLCSQMPSAVPGLLLSSENHV